MMPILDYCNKTSLYYNKEEHLNLKKFKENDKRRRIREDLNIVLNSTFTHVKVIQIYGSKSIVQSFFFLNLKSDIWKKFWKKFWKKTIKIILKKLYELIYEKFFSEQCDRTYKVQLIDIVETNCR